MTHKIGVVLSGCGFKDGAEIQESICALLALDKMGLDVVCMAPDIPQAKVVNHLTGEATTETRNVLAESARIARGKVVDIASVAPSTLDALVLPGGFGAAMNLSDFATNGSKATVNQDLEKLLLAVHQAGKPICAICIAPVVIARVLGKAAPTVTVGSEDDQAVGELKACGAVHESCGVHEFVVDKKNKIVTTPAYMLGPSIVHVAEGIERAIRETVALIDM